MDYRTRNNRNLKQMEKDLNYWRNNAEEDYIGTPISVLRYICELENAVAKGGLDDTSCLKIDELSENNVSALDLLNGFAISFINSHYEELNLDNLEWKVSKDEAIKEIHANPTISSWIITEVMSWGTSKDYLKQHLVDNEDGYCVVNINNRYFMYSFDKNMLIEVYPKKETFTKLVFKSHDSSSGDPRTDEQFENDLL